MRYLTICLFLAFCLGSASAQAYDHYVLNWWIGNQHYAGVMALNTRTSNQILRLSYYNVDQGGYRLLEQRFRTTYDGNFFYLRNIHLSDQTFCYTSHASNYVPDNFYFIGNGRDIEMWCVDEAGVSAPVNIEFIPIHSIDSYKPYFWPEVYQICGTAYWQQLIFSLMNQ